MNELGLFAIFSFCFFLGLGIFVSCSSSLHAQRQQYFHRVTSLNHQLLHMSFHVPTSYLRRRL